MDVFMDITSETFHSDSDCEFDAISHNLNQSSALGQI